MKRLMCLWLIMITIGNTSCQDASEPLPSANLSDSSAVLHDDAGKITILTLFPEAKAIDSLVILYFTDKVKFRYYTFCTTVDAGHLSLFKDNLQSDTTSSNDCVKDGTIYGYIKGNVHTTLYFNLSDSCGNLRLFKHGKLYTFPLTASFQSELASLKKESVNP